MHQGVISLLVAGCLSSSVTAFQGRSGSTPANRACELLTRELVTKTSPYEKRALDMALRMPPEEDALAAGGSACTSGGITLQIDPMRADRLAAIVKPDWQKVSGVGDLAYFRDNGGEYAELYVRAGAHIVTVQMDVPAGKGAAALQSNVVAVARDVLSRLK